MMRLWMRCGMYKTGCAVGACALLFVLGVACPVGTQTSEAPNDGAVTKAARALEQRNAASAGSAREKPTGTGPSRLMGSGSSAAELMDGCVAWWTFADGARDIRGQHAGRLRGRARIVENAEGDAVLDLHGKGDYLEVTCGSPFNARTAITLAAWIKLSSYAGGDIVAGLASHRDPGVQLYALSVGIDRRLRFTVGGRDVATADNTPSVSAVMPGLNLWHHLVATYESADVMRLYLDAVLVRSKRVHAVLQGEVRRLLFGKGVGGDSLKGQIGNVMIYERALAPSEITQLYQGQKPAMQGSLARTLQRTVTSVRERSVCQDGAFIQKLLDAAEPDTTVELPEGCFEVREPIVVPAGIRIVGSGYTGTILCQHAPPTRTDHRHGLQISDAGPEHAPRISRLAYVNTFPPDDTILDKGIEVYGCKDFRVDNCYFEGFGSAAVWVEGDSRGVVDHCVFVDNYKPALENIGYGVGVKSDDTWNYNMGLGSAEAVFIEDCAFAGSRHAVASSAGAHYVFRHNVVEENVVSHAIDAHGAGYGAERGTQCVEIYENTISSPRHDPGTGAPGDRPTDIGILIRGGGGVIFNNLIADYIDPIELVLEFGMPDALRGEYPWRDQVHDLWIWNNVGETGGICPKVNGYAPSPEYILLNRDYFMRQKPGYVSFPYPHPSTQSE